MADSLKFSLFPTLIVSISPMLNSTTLILADLFYLVFPKCSIWIS